DDLTELAASPLVIPGDPENSPLFTKTVTGAMPPVEAKPHEDAIEDLRTWIETGAEPWCDGGDDPDPGGGSCENEFVHITDIAKLIDDDLDLEVDADDRPFTRYLTLVHHHNNNMCQDRLDRYRYAMSKLVNSLSRAPLVRQPLPIDDNQLIYRVDIRDYDWDRVAGGYSDAWELVAAKNKLAIEWKGKLFDDVKINTGTDFPLQPFDAFAEVAVRSDVYHEIVNIPHTSQQLKSDLGVSCNVDDGTMRAGFKDSGVSDFNRAIERCQFEEASNRAYWESFDFGNDTLDCSSIFQEPINFCKDGGEIIFSLANGFQAYMITDAAGNRLNEAPTGIVQDKNAPDNTVRNPLSCMSCHAEGIKEEQDEVRPFVLDEYPGNYPVDEVNAVDELYVVHAEMDAVIAQDRGLFAAALLSAGVPQDLEYEPISWTVYDYDEPLDLDRAAAEIGVSPQYLQERLAALPDPFQGLGTETIPRNQFNNHFQQIVCEFFFDLDADPAQCE
ncbi:MAG: hypothetical protein KC468_06770, partial [Myxococcales bacterium]|nr:hypothetical protein [Myxococcales bacterium]